MLVASRESSVLRMKGETLSSNEVLESAMRRHFRYDETSVPSSGDIKCNSLVGKVIQSRAENLIFADNLEQAQRELDKWRPVNAAFPSSMEKSVQVSIDLTLGRLAKIQGRFEASLGQLILISRQILAEDIDAGGWRKVLLAITGEIYCELDQPVNAQSVLLPEINCLELTKSQNTSSGLRLQLALGEAYFRAKSYEKSREVAANVHAVLERSKQHKQHNSITRRFYLRAWTLLARIAHTCENWDDALVCWNGSLEILGLMHESSGPSAAIVEFSIADLLQKQGHVDMSAEKVALARNHMNSEKARRYHFPGFDSYWRDTIVSRSLRPQNSQ